MATPYSTSDSSSEQISSSSKQMSAFETLTTFKAYMSNMLTILRDQAYSVATIYHVMDKIRDTVSLLSLGPRTSACDHSRSANI